MKRRAHVSPLVALAAALALVAACGTSGDDGLVCNGDDAGTVTSAQSSCAPGFADCDGKSDNACETEVETSPSNCGACGHACGATNGTASCRAGVCALACDPGFADCNGVNADGCEVDTNTDTSHCGTCAVACGTTNGQAACQAGACSLACDPGFADCDGINADGCEVDTDSSADQCGSCSTSCAATNCTPACNLGTCLPTCATGFGDCDGQPQNGCETGTSADVSNCGACGHVCVAVNGTPRCTLGACSTSCSLGFADCDGNEVNGCEVNTASDLDDCGGCGLVCSGANAVAVCSSGVCELECTAGWGNCDGLAANGCEHDLSADSANCGACGNACTVVCNADNCVGVSEMALGADHTSLRMTDGSRRGFGTNDVGQLDLVPSSPLLVPSALPAFVGGTFALGSRTSCAWFADGSARCFGSNASGQIGNGTTTDTVTPFTLPLSNVVGMTVGIGHACAAISNGTVFCWGSNTEGEVGNGSAAPSEPSPVQVSGLTGVTQVAAGSDHTCALVAGGVMCWGQNADGQCGDGLANAIETTPVVVGTSGTPLAGATQVGAGESHACALLTDGTVVCWGAGASGQVGDGTGADRSTPVNVATLTGATQIALGYNHTCALLASGSVACWGDGTLGQMGNGSTTAVNLSPVPVAGIVGAVELQAGGNRTCARFANGTLQCWGSGSSGQIGNGSTSNATSPVSPTWH